MKTLIPRPRYWLSFILLILAAVNSQAQFARQAIDEELLSGLVQAKQEEVRARALRILVNSSIKNGNLSTYNTLNDLLDILLTEKNKTVLTRDLTITAAEHGIAYAATWAFITDTTACKQCYIAQGKDKGFTAGTNNENRPWQQLKKAVHESRSSNADLAHIGGKDPQYLLTLQGYILDRIAYAFRDPSLVPGLTKALRDRGLFVRSKQRAWQGDVDLRYAEFWKDKAASKLALNAEVDTFINKIARRAFDWTRLANAVSFDDTIAVAQLDLNTLVGTKRGMPITDGGATQNAKARAVFELFRRAMDIYRYVDTDDRLIARLADIIDKYVILDPDTYDENSRFGFSIDVEAIILDMEVSLLRSGVSPMRNCFFNVRPFFTIGVNYGAFRDNRVGFTAEENNGLTTISWAGERIGLKWRLWDWKYTRSQPAKEVFKYMGMHFQRNVRPKEPAVSNLYLSAYGSGLLYTIADLRSENTFNRPIVGAGGGLTLFNGLEVNMSYAVPLLNDATPQEAIDAGFWNLGMDIPIFEYIRAAREKKAK